MALDKLSFSDRFYGRVEEVERIQQAYRELGASTSAVFVGGYSGTGKTRLVQHAIRELHDNKEEDLKPFLYCSGKADELLSADPFSSIVNALTQLLGSLETQERVSLRDRVVEAVGSEGQVLTALLPELEELIGEQPDAPTSLTASNSQNRFTYLFQKLLKAICTPEKPLIMHLDDLQWTDASSLDLIYSLLIDEGLHHFLFVGSYRDNEVDDTHPLRTILDELRNERIPCTSILLTNLSEEEVRALVEDTLRTDEADELVQVLYSKTHGNIFYVKACLLQLERKQILQFSLATCSWVWDNQRLLAEIEVSENVVTLVLANLKRTGNDLQTVIMVAAHLRSSFSLSLLFALMRDRLAYPEDRSTLESVLRQGVVDGFLRHSSGSDDMFHFIHDRVRQAALLLAKENGRQVELMLEVGHFLLSYRNADAWMFFAGIDHLNTVPLGDVVERGISIVDMVELNTRAGKKAARLSSYAPSARYYRKAVELIEELGPHRWREHYDLCLGLYCSAAEIELSIGSFELGTSYAKAVFANAKSPLDSIRSQLSLAESLGRQQRNHEAIDVYKEVLVILDEKPRNLNLFQVVRTVKRTKRMYNDLTVDQIADLPRLLDPRRVEALTVLTKMSIRAVWAGNKPLVAWAVCRCCDITVVEGVCPASTLALSLLSALLAGFDLDFAIKLGRAYKLLAMKLGAKSMESQILFNASIYVDPWTVPLPEVTVGLRRAYQSGMESGEFEAAFNSLQAASILQYAAGRPLDVCLEEANHIIGLIRQYKVETVRLVAEQALLRAPMDLSGKTTDPLSWASKEVEPPSRSLDMSTIIQLIWRYTSCLQIAYYLGEVELACRIADYADAIEFADLTCVGVSFRIFFRALAYTALYRKSPKRKYRTQARKALRRMRSRVEKKDINNLHKYYILEADTSATFGLARGKEKELYDKAISKATRTGFVQDGALANELAGEYFASRGDKFWAKHYLTKAYTMYEMWQARAKTKRLADLYGNLLDADSALSDDYISRKKSCKPETMSAVQMHHTLNTERDALLRSKDGGSSRLTEELSYGLSSHSLPPYQSSDKLPVRDDP